MTVARRLVHSIAAGLTVIMLLTLAARAADPFVRTSIQADQPIRSGQQVRVDVDVYVPNFFMSPPQFPLLDMPDAVVSLMDGATNLNETVGDDSFAGIRRSYLITPQADGTFSLPPAEISFTYAAVPGKATPGKVTLPTTAFTVEGAPGGGADGATIAAAKITVTQSLDRDTAGLRAGDALVRTITVAADGMQSMMIPEPDLTAPDGVRIYRHDPKLVDEQAPRGGFVGGRRTDTVTYLFEKAGSFTLPSIEIGWFDPKTGKTETASASAIEVVIAGGLPTQTAIAPPAPEKKPETLPLANWRTWLLVALAGSAGLALLTWLLVSLLPRALAAARKRRVEWEQSEPAYFKRFLAACSHGDEDAIYAGLDAWSRMAKAAPLSAWLAAHGDDAVIGAYEDICASRFGGAARAGTGTARLAQGIKRARGNWLKRNAPERPALPPLNPLMSPS